MKYKNPNRVPRLKHSHASMLISELEVPLLLVAQRLGHEKIQTTLQTYSHLYPSQAEKLADKLEALKQKLHEQYDNENRMESDIYAGNT